MHVHDVEQKNQQLICRTCDVVLATVFEIPKIPADVLSDLGIIDTINSNSYQNAQYYTQVWKTKEQFYVEQYRKVYNRLLSIIEKEHLPRSYANETMRILLLRKKGIWSFRWQITTLVQVLQNQHDIRLKNHIRHIKEQYRDARGT